MKLLLKEKTVSRRKIFAVFAAAFIFALAGCIHYGSGGDYNIGHLGDTLKLEGQVFSESRDNIRIEYEPFEDNLGVLVERGVGGIIEGSLSFTIPTPARLTAGNWGWLERTNVTAVPANTRHVRLVLDTPRGVLFRGHEIAEGTFTDGERTINRAEFIYVDRDVNLRAELNERLYDNDVLHTFRGNPFNLTLQAGWNVMHIEIFTDWGPGDNETRIHTTHNVVSLGEPAGLKWILEDSQN